MKIHSVNLYEYNIPLVKPLAMMKYVMTSRQGYIAEIRDYSENRYYSDFSPFQGIHKETKRKLFQNLEAMTAMLPGRRFNSMKSILTFYDDYPAENLVRFGCETMLLGLYAANKKVGFPILISQKPDSVVSVCALLPAPDGAKDRVKSLIERGYKAVKVKVGYDLNSEIKALKNIVGLFESKGVKLRLDANRRFRPEEAEALYRSLPSGMVDYFEEPVKNFKDLKSLHESTGVPLALDESVYKCDDIRNLKLPPGAAALIVKPPAVGGYLKIFNIRRFAHDNNLRIIISSAFETDIGISALIILCSGMNLYPEPMGLDTNKWLTESLRHNGSELNGPEIDVSKVMGKNQVNKDLLSKKAEMNDNA